MKKVLALVLVAVVLASCTACTTIELVIPVAGVPAGNVNTNTNTNTNTQTPPAEQATQAPAPQEQTTAAQQAPSAEQTTAAQQTPSTETTTQAPAQNNGTPTAKADIVKLYCDAYNKLSTASSIKRTYDYTSNYNKILDIDGGNATLAKIADKLMGMFMKENTEEIDFSVADLPPVGASTINIDPALIANATCKDMGDYYEVVLYSTGTAANREVDSPPITGSAGSFGPLLKAEDVSGAAAGFVEFQGLHTYYETATVKANITKDGKITALEFNTPCILHFDSVSAMKIVNVGVCELGLLFQQRYKIAY
ncbi:MAG: hypothetical protein IJN70_05885 [Clostridia bacterium]|nr:hypothetical protein [Clostridia bacterium]